MVLANSSPRDWVHLGRRHNSSTTPIKARTKDRLRRFGKLKIVGAAAMPSNASNLQR
jgi:hypothetical protein